VDFSLKRNTTLTIGIWFCSFNPCFGGFFSKTCYRIEHFPLPEPVSILVLVDFSLKPTGVEYPTKADINVSILVLVDFSLKQRWRNPIGRCTKVSILVLVDFSLKHNKNNEHNFLLPVSILVLVDFSLKQPLPFLCPHNRLLFQSLFWWIFL